MNIYETVFIIYICFISLIAVVITIYDKIRAVKHKWRVKESTLLLISALGGSAAMYITMFLIHHKTRHLKFMLGIPAIFVLQLAALYFVWRFFYVG